MEQNFPSQVTSDRTDPLPARTGTMLPTTKILLSPHGAQQVRERLGPKTDEEIITMIRQCKRLSERLKKAIRRVGHPNFFGPAHNNLYLENSYGVFVLRPRERGEFVLLTFLYRNVYDAIADQEGL